MDWEDLKIFLAVARLESLSRAQSSLKKDAATIGRRIARLEQHLGQPLFAKSPRGYALSDAGQRLFRHAEQMEQAANAGRDAMRGQAGELSGQIRIGATDGCASFVLPQVCARIQAKHPDLELQIIALPRVINLSKREADMAITVSPPQSGRVTVQKITDYKLHLATTRKYLENNSPINSVDDLNKHRIIGYIQDMISFSELDFNELLQIDRASLASNLVSVQLGFLRAGAGVGVTHDFILPSAPDLVRVLPEQVSFSRAYYLLRHESDAKVERISRISQAIIEGVRKEVARLEGLVVSP